MTGTDAGALWSASAGILRARAAELRFARVRAPRGLAIYHLTNTLKNIRTSVFFKRVRQPWDRIVTGVAPQARPGSLGDILKDPHDPTDRPDHRHTRAFCSQKRSGTGRTGGLWHGIQFGRKARGNLTSTVGAVSQEIPWPTPLESPQMRLTSMVARRMGLHIVSIRPTLYWYSVRPEAARTFARITNEDLAEMVAGAPDRFAGLGYLPLQDVEGAIAELERCVTVHGFAGVMIGTNVNGADWDDAALFPLLEAAEAKPNPSSGS